MHVVDLSSESEPRDMALADFTNDLFWRFGFAMDIGFIDMCIKGYNGKLDEEDERRLLFFRVLWEIMANAIDRREEASPYKVPSLEELKELYAAGTPIFETAPVSIDAQEFKKTAQAIAGYLVDSGNYDQSLAEALSTIDWASIFEASQSKANSIDQFLEDLYEQLVENATDLQAAQLGALVASLSLYTFLEAPAKAIMDAIGYDEVIDTHPLFCPVCGGEPMLSSVGAKTSSAGRGRLLYCLNCGTAWEFDRIRCAHCGTHDQTKLHYVSVEGDEDHRLGLCDECGGFMRTTFIDNNLFPISPLVEDVIMAPLAVIGTEQSLTNREHRD